MKFNSKTENNLFKNELYKLFFSKIDADDKIVFMNQYEVDEISFEINHNDSSKTFYLKNRNKMRSTIDVSNRLEYIDSQPTNASMKKVSTELIQEILGYGSSDFNQVA